MRILSTIAEYLGSCNRFITSSMVMGGRPAGAPPSCPRCGSRATYVEKYGRWFCDRCEEYVREQSSSYRDPRKCGTCRSALEYVRKYDRWFCDRCERYAPSGGREHGPRENAEETKRARRSCSRCGSGLDYARKYDRWWCEQCGSYDRPSKEMDLREVGERTAPHRERAREEELAREHDSRDQVDCIDEARYGEYAWKGSLEDKEEEDFQLDVDEHYPDEEADGQKENDEEKVCSSCGESVRYVEKYGRWWCEGCGRYEREQLASSLPVATPVGGNESESKMKDLQVGDTQERKPGCRPVGAVRSSGKGFEIFITIFIIVLAIGASLTAYQGIQTKNKGDDKLLSAEESVLRGHAFDIITDEEKKVYSSYILDAQSYHDIMESYIIMYLSERDDPKGDAAQRDLYWDIAGDALNKSQGAKRSFVRLFSLTMGEEYTDPDMDENYQEALEDYEDYFIEIQRISAGMREDADESYDDADDYEEQSDQYGYSTIILTVGTLVASLSLLPDKKKNKVVILVFTMMIFASGICLGVVTFLKIA